MRRTRAVASPSWTATSNARRTVPRRSSRTCETRSTASAPATASCSKRGCPPLRPRVADHVPLPIAPRHAFGRLLPQQLQHSVPRMAGMSDSSQFRTCFERPWQRLGYGRVDAVTAQPGGSCYYVFDSRVAASRSKLIETLGAPPTRAGNLQELAGIVGCDAPSFRRTVQRWNDFSPWDPPETPRLAGWCSPTPLWGSRSRPSTPLGSPWVRTSLRAAFGPTSRCVCSTSTATRSRASTQPVIA